jgi:hypothetical protein
VFQPLADQPEPPNGLYGWIATAIVAVLGAFGTWWAGFRKTKREDTTTALTHANGIIAGYKRYADQLEKRMADAAKQADDRDKNYREQIERQWRVIRDTTVREERAQLRISWLEELLREHEIEVPPWSLDSGGDS